MSKFKRYTTLIDERAPCSDPMVKAAADSLLDQAVNRTCDQLEKELLSEIGELPLGNYWNKRMVGYCNEDAEMMEYKDAPTRFITLNLTDTSLKTLNMRELSDLCECLSAAVSQFITLKKDKWKFTQPILGIQGDLSFISAKIALAPKEESEKSTT